MTASPISANAFDADLQDILSRVLEIDLTCNPPHDIVEGLTHYGCTTWKALRRIGRIDIAGLSKKSGQQRVPLMGYSLRQLSKFYEFYEYNVDNNVPDHVLAATYTLADFDSFVDNHRNAPLPTALPPSNSHVKSPAEQKLQDWNRGKRNKTDFEVLKEDKHHDSWEIPFKGEIVQQGLDVMIDPNFDPIKDVQPGFE